MFKWLFKLMGRFAGRCSNKTLVVVALASDKELDSRCEKCGVPLVYNGTHDAICCVECDEWRDWVEEKIECECARCVSIPKKPSEASWTNWID